MATVLSACTTETSEQQQGQGDVAEQPLLPYGYWSYVTDEGAGNRGSGAGRLGNGGVGEGAGEGDGGAPERGSGAGGASEGGTGAGGAPCQGGSGGDDEGGGGDPGGQGGRGTCGASCGSGKAILCHVPPGNPGNAHTIAVGTPAVPAHLAHGDHLGACRDDARR